MKLLIFLILCTMFSAVFSFAQMSQMIQTGFTVERELGERDKQLPKKNY